MMGCITSTNKLNELENVFRVRVAHLQPSSPGMPSVTRSGYLELNPRELIFSTPGGENIVWALQHLRRYGLNADLFSFEAGRRCMSGPGIYTFRVHNAEQLYPMFQRYINAVNTDAFAQVERERVNSAHSVSVLMMGRPRSDVNPHSNNYLEPAPLINRHHLLPEGNATNESLAAAFTMDDSSDLLPCAAYANTQTNVYFDQPVCGLSDRLQEEVPAVDLVSSPPSTRLDRPPQESAPPPAPPAAHMYANVETPSACGLRDRLVFDLSSSDRCYENINRLDLPQLQRESCNSSSTTTEPATPTSLAVGSSSGGVNYIVLDLDQPRSPAAQSNGFGSGLSLTSVIAGSATAPVTPEANTILEVPVVSLQAQSLSSVPETAASKMKTEISSTQAGYSTIDFIRTYALNKTTAEMPELPPPPHHHQHHPHEAEELRITRHSKCIRKAYSISE